MKRFGRALVVALGIAVLGSVVSLIPQKNATGAGSAPVSVVNTPLPVNVSNAAGNPVPVSGLVAVGNERTLAGGGFVPVPLDVNVTNGTLPVTGSVSISGTPTVHLASPNLSLNGPVQVTNPTQAISTPFGSVTQAVPLLVNDGNVFNPYRTSCSESGGVTGSSGRCDLGVVPNGQELVIEQVAGHIPGASPGTVQLTLSRVYVQVGTQNYDLATFLTGNDVGISERVRLYADPGTDVVLNIIGNCPCRSAFSLSGYTVNLSQQ